MPIRQGSPAEPPTQHTAWPAPFPSDEAHRTRPSQALLPDAQPLAGPGEEPGTQPTSPHTVSPPARTILLSLAVALLGFAAMAALIHLALPHPLYLHADYRTGKLQLVSAWQGRAFSAAFGSSHVHQGFDPRGFDRALDGSPLATHSLNLGILGGSQIEQRAMALDFVRRLQAPAPGDPSACFVLLELTAGANFTNDHLVHPRAINLYDAGADRFALKLVSPKMPRSQRIGRLSFVAAASFLHFVNLGMLSNRVFPSTTPDSGFAAETADDRRGLLTLDLGPKVRSDMEAILRRSPSHPVVTPGLLLPGNAALVQELAAATPLHNVHFIYFIVPKLSNLTDETSFPPALTVDGRLVPIINLAQPALYPQLYRLDNWTDDAHLNAQGAALATTLLAESLRSFYAAHPTPMGCGA